MKKFLAGSILVAMALGMSGMSALADDDVRERREQKVALNFGAKIRSILGIKERENEDREEREEKREEIKAEVKATVEIKKEERKDARTASQIEKKDAQDLKKKENIQKFWDRMEKRLQGLINNQTKLAGRIDAKLVRMEAEGKDVVALKEKLVAAHALIVQAQATLDAGDAKVETALENPDLKIAFEAVRQINKDVLVKIREVHRALVDIIRNANAVRSPTPIPVPSPTTS